MNTTETIRQKAAQLLVGPLLDATERTVNEIVEALQMHAAIADEQSGLECFPPGVPIVFLEIYPDHAPRFVFTLPAETPLAVALERLADQAELVVGYHPTGILLSPARHPSVPRQPICDGFSQNPPAPAPTVSELESQIAALAEQLRQDREGEGYLTPEHSQRLEHIMELRLELRFAKFLQMQHQAPETLPAPAPVAVQFEGGPADGLTTEVLLPNAPHFTMPGYDGVLYAAPGADGVAHFAGWMRDRG